MPGRLIGLRVCINGCGGRRFIILFAANLLASQISLAFPRPDIICERYKLRLSSGSDACYFSSHTNIELHLVGAIIFANTNLPRADYRSFVYSSYDSISR